ncbi:AlwI family type II restriction endonuclease [Natronincola ferrireducens]|uniref:AlwI restriction endonuclease n=1 Tax=Natronincola ferrireducens TaxID=393762 RepID=A0A1G9H7S6_9FIRM|nr:AlwI family type II restriction endonuclease [Natronincola ferrireducens]SDL09011.1 AlwI restriction endonuclease [Natronincola ferrireducens]
MAERKIWFITRPERDPKFHKAALVALQEATNNFADKWARNREVHKHYEKVLSEHGLKRENISNDGSGGRTWVAMLKTFAYCYVNDDGYLVPTKVGASLINGVEVFENTKKQILTLQIPNAYFLEPGFRPKFESNFSIRPARFLIKLVNQKELDYYITKEEIACFALTAKRDSELPTITEKILQYRGTDTSHKDLIIREVAEVYDHRERSDSGARDYQNAHSDVAHTFMMLCDYTGLAEYIRGEALRVQPVNSSKVKEEVEMFDERYPFNKRYLISLQRMAESNGLDISRYKASSFGEIKPASNRKKTDMIVKNILKSIPNLQAMSVEEITDVLKNEFPPHEARKIAFDINAHSINTLNPEFVEAYLNEKDNLKFEDKTGDIFRLIGFDVEMRPNVKDIADTEIEIVLKYGEKECGLIDAKNYKKKFPLSAGLASHMASEYIPNYEGYDNRQIQFFGYVTAADFSGEKNLGKISELTQRVIPDREIKGIIITASVLLAFLDYCIEEDIPKEERVELFINAVNNTGYSTFGEMLNAIT